MAIDRRPRMIKAQVAERSALWALSGNVRSWLSTVPVVQPDRDAHRAKLTADMPEGRLTLPAVRYRSVPVAVPGLMVLGFAAPGYPGGALPPGTYTIYSAGPYMGSASGAYLGRHHG